MTKKNILFLLDNPYSNDRRVMREAEALNKSDEFTVQVIATFKAPFLKQEKSMVYKSTGYFFRTLKMLRTSIRIQNTQH